MKKLVVIPIHNGERFVERTLRSILNQSSAPDQIICIDDASTDRSAALVHGLIDSNHSIEIIENEARLGLAGNWNRALELSSGFDLLTIAHQDDIYESDYLEAVEQALTSHPESFIAHTKATIIDERDEPVYSPATIYKDKFWGSGHVLERPVEEELTLLLRGDYVFCPSVSFRVSSLDEVGRFSQKYEFVPDWDYWLRGLLSGRTIVGINRRLIRYRVHPGSATAIAEKTLRRYSEEIEIVDRYRKIALSRGMDLQVEYTAAENTLADGVVRLLEAADRVEARRVLNFGKDNIPGFRGRPLSLLLSSLVPLGRIGGAILRLGMLAYFVGSRAPR